MKIGITGSAGFIGKAIAARARAAGHEVVGLDRVSGADFVGDVGDLALLRRFCRGLDRVYHTAAIVQETGAWDAFFRVNVLAPDSVALAAREQGVRELIHLSSVMVHGFDFPDGVTEEGPLDPANNPYCTTKILSEEAVLRHHDPGKFDVYLIRPGDVYGPGSIPWTVRPVQMMKQRRWLYVEGTRSILNHVFADNLLDGIDLVLERQASGTPFTISDGVRTTVKEFFGHYERLLGMRGFPDLPRAVALPAATIAGRFLPDVNRQAVRYMLRGGVYSIAKIAGLGYRPRVGLEEGMTRTAEWLRREGLVG
jgi:nucleoside-diphosphate-sugar epimerase